MAAPDRHLNSIPTNVYPLPRMQDEQNRWAGDPKRTNGLRTQLQVAGDPLTTCGHPHQATVTLRTTTGGATRSCPACVLKAAARADGISLIDPDPWSAA